MKTDSVSLALAIEALCERAANAMSAEEWRALTEADDTKEALWHISEAIDTLNGQLEDLKAAKRLCGELAGMEAG